MISVMTMVRRGYGTRVTGLVALFAFILSPPSLSPRGPALGGPASGSLAPVGLAEASAQETRAKSLGEELRWDLPHDRAAQYDQFDARTGKPKGQFWLLGCELDRKVGWGGLR